MTLMDIAPLSTRAGAFIEYLDEWLDDLLPLPLESLIQEAGGPQHVGVFCVDVINGFCYEGPLASSRVAGVVPPIVELFESLYASGVEHFVLTHDAHNPAAVEFVDYPPHCIRGTSESEIVPELMAASVRFQIPSSCQKYHLLQRRHNPRRLAGRASRHYAPHCGRRLHGYLHVPIGNAPETTRQRRRQTASRNCACQLRGHLRHSCRNRAGRRHSRASRRPDERRFPVQHGAQRHSDCFLYLLNLLIAA